MGAPCTPDSRMAGQAVRVPELPERLRPHTAPLRPCVQIQTQSGHFLGAEQPQASGFPLGTLVFHLRMEGLSSSEGWAGLPWTRDRGEGHVSCSFQLRLCGHELVSETVPDLAKRGDEHGVGGQGSLLIAWTLGWGFST